MKKSIIILVGLVALSASGVSFAQDTVDGTVLKSNYMYSNCPFYFGDKNIMIFVNSGLSSLGTEGGEKARRCHTDSSITIYGIAAGLWETHADAYASCYDTSYDNSIEYLRLYIPTPDSLRWVRQERIHLHHTPVSYYAHYQTGYYLDYLDEYLPMYERYFDSAITVTDSFYVGMTLTVRRNYSPDGNSHYFQDRPGFLLPSLMQWAYQSDEGYDNLDCGEVTYTCFYNSDEGNTWFRRYEKPPYMIYPILTPPDTTALGSDTSLVSGDTMIVCDTVIVGGDTLVVYDTVYIGDILVGSDTVAMGDTLVVTDTLVIGGDTIVVTDTILAVMPPDLLQRLTGVTPNPARGTARVVASTGLTMVESYSMAGRKVHTQRVPQGALSVTLDVSRWPAGTYLLRIHTPLGATVKKLTVTR